MSTTLPSPYTSMSPSTENCEFGQSFVFPTSTLAKGSRALVVTMPEKPEDSNIRMAADGYANLAKDIHSAPACFIAWDVHLTIGMFCCAKPLEELWRYIHVLYKTIRWSRKNIWSVQCPNTKTQFEIVLSAGSILYAYRSCRYRSGFLGDTNTGTVI